MKKLFAILFALSASSLVANSQLLKKLGDKVKTKTDQRTDQKVDQAIDKGLDKTEDVTKTDGKPATNNEQDKSIKPASTGSDSTPPKPVVFKAYQNYDFIPGEKILFEDHFTDDQDGEFAAHWKLEKGQAVVNKVEGKPAFLITEGNYGTVYPRMKTDKYLTGDFTLEFDFIFKTDKDGAIGYGPGVEFYYMGDYESSFRVAFGINEVSIGDFSKTFPEELRDGFENKWHHAALILKNGQMKAYVDQYRVCVNPNIDQKPYKIAFDGIGSDVTPLIFTNVKLAEGGGMNIIGQKFTDAKIVTHGINFDVNKAVIKPESMGTLNGIVKILNDNPELKFEVGGHTDSDGDDAANMKLSQARADAVRNQLITMGIDGSRLTTKGYGETKPISDNTTPEGKANNRRVEFVKK
jgi:outer membrane protein OmpA-like peptidoglycan-associated protein